MECSVCELRRTVHKCGIEGCDRLASTNANCNECEGGIAALRRMAALADERRERKAQRMYGAAVRFEAICLAVRRRLWVICLTGVMVGLMILALDWGEAFMEWIEAGGVR